MEHPVDFLPELALGVLPPGDAAEVREHLISCDLCQAEFEEMTRVAALLPMAVEDVEPPAALKSSLMERIASEPTVLRPRTEGQNEGRGRALRFAVPAAIAAAVLVVAAGIGGYALRGDDSGDFQAESDRQTDLLEAVALGRSQTTGTAAGDVRAMVVRAPGSNWAFTYVQNLPPLPEGKAYQAWFTRDGQSFEPSEVFTTSDGGVWLQADDSLDGYAAMAFTIEDEDGATAPSQAPFAQIALQTTARR